MPCPAEHDPVIRPTAAATSRPARRGAGRDCTTDRAACVSARA
ncbi:hypothetical protein RAA17_20300 [Komagataeibacter rhaeticus]|nr:hypothetical protein [Komagataeibacter rhaeticus]